MVCQPIPRSAASITPGPSSHNDSARNGNGGTRLPHTTSPTRFTLPTLRVTILPSAHIEAAQIVRRNPPRVMPSPLCAPISARPQAAINRPSRLAARKRSPRNSAAKNSVKNAWDCSTSDARPAGMPCFMAVKRKANWPSEMVSP